MQNDHRLESAFVKKGFDVRLHAIKIQECILYLQMRLIVGKITSAFIKITICMIDLDI